jgi:hypothetical protein
MTPPRAEQAHGVIDRLAAVGGAHARRPGEVVRRRIVVRRPLPPDELELRPALLAPVLVARLVPLAERLEDRVGVERALLVILHVAHVIVLEDREPLRGVAGRADRPRR